VQEQDTTISPLSSWKDSDVKGNKTSKLQRHILKCYEENNISNRKYKEPYARPKVRNSPKVLFNMFPDIERRTPSIV
jgi:hypothetical protein